MPKKLFEKGKSAKPNGRHESAMNRTTQEIRDIIQMVMDKNLQTWNKTWKICHQPIDDLKL